METGISTQQHWEKVYTEKQEDEVSWFQSYPAKSMEILQSLPLLKDAAIIDIGGGDSHFVDALLDLQFRDISVLDISANAIYRAKQRLGRSAKPVNWIVSNILDFHPTRQFDFWHDRAAFHFLKDDAAISTYIAIAAKAVQSGATSPSPRFRKMVPNNAAG